MHIIYVSLGWSPREWVAMGSCDRNFQHHYKVQLLFPSVQKRAEPIKIKHGLSLAHTLPVLISHCASLKPKLPLSATADSMEMNFVKI
jgi:hypothetical protein